MSTTPKFPTHAEQLLEALAVFSTKGQISMHRFSLDADDCAALVSHVRTQANTLASTQAELELARNAYSELREIMAEQREKHAAAIAGVEHELNTECTAHLAARRALATLIRGVCEALGKIDPDSDSLVAHILTKALPDDYAARAEVAKADACKKNDPVFLTNSEPRADAQKGEK